MGAPRLYALYDNGELVFTGTSAEISKILFIERSSFSNYVDKRKYDKRWEIKNIGVLKKEDKQKERKKTTHQRILEDLITVLKYQRHDETYMHKSQNPEDYREELREQGIEFEVRKPTVFKDGYTLRRI